MIEPKTYTLDDIPADAEPNTGKSKEFAPIDPTQFYQVEVLKAELRDNPYYKPEAKKPEEKGSKYQISFEFAILNDGEFYGRRLWRKTSLSLMPTTRKGEPTVLYKIVSNALKSQMDWDACASFAPDTKTLMVNLQETVIGKQLLVSIENVVNPETKKTKANIKSFNETKKDMPKFDQEKSTAMAEQASTIEPMTEDPLEDLGLDNTALDEAIDNATKPKKK